MLIDKISYSSPIKDINPGIKFILSMMTLVFIIYSQSKAVYILNFLLFNLLLLCTVKVKISDLLRLNFIPALFIFMTAVSLVFIKGDVLRFLMRTFSSISVVYFLICSTPVSDLDYIFLKLKFPKIFREMFLLIYRYIFLLTENTEKLINSQNSRLGYSSYRNGMKSFPMLVAAIFRKTYYYSLNSVKSVESRMGKEFLFQQRKYRKIRILEIFFLAAIFIINLSLVIIYG